MLYIALLCYYARLDLSLKQNPVIWLAVSIVEENHVSIQDLIASEIVFQLVTIFREVDI